MEGFNKNVFDPKIATGLDFNAFPNKRRWNADMNLFPNGLYNVSTYTPILGVPLMLGYLEHPLALNFKNRIISEGGQLKDYEYFAINYRLFALDLLNIQDYEIAYYPFLGGNSDQQSISNFAHNLISSSYKLTNTSVTSAMCSINGYKGNGTTSFWNTGLSPNGLFTSSARLSYYSRTNSNATIFDIGSSDGSSAFVFGFANYSGVQYFDSFSQTTGRISITSRSDGYIVGNRISSVSNNILRNGKLITSGTNSGGTPPVRSLYLGAYNTTPSTINFSNREYASMSISMAIPLELENLFFIIEQNVQSFLGRAILT